MLLSTQTDALARRHGDEQAVRLLAEEGFDAYDFSFFRMFSQKDYEMNRPDFRDYAKKIRAAADDAGIVCNQAHAPFPSGVGDPARDEEAFRIIVQSIEAAGILGAKVIVIHPIHHLPYITHAAELKEINMEFYRRLIPYCEKFGVQAGCENMWQRNKATNAIIDSTCSRPEEFRDYLDTLNSPWVVACLDVGHTQLTDEDLGHCIRTLGKDRLKALHVHDVDLVEDSHMLPFTQKVNFAQLIEALAEIGYEGDFTFEADSLFWKMPQALEADALHFMHRVGRYFVTEIENRK